MALLSPAIGCQQLNPAFKPDNRDKTSSSESSTEKTSGDPSTSIDGTESVDSETASSTSTQDQSSLTTSASSASEPPDIESTPHCEADHSICFSMQENAAGSVVEEQGSGMAFEHNNTRIESLDPSVEPPPWDSVLVIPEYGAFAATQRSMSIPDTGELGLEVLAKELSCNGILTRCPIIAVNGAISINYINGGWVECEAWHQGTTSPDITKFSVFIGANTEKVRAVCWSDGASIMLWANGKYVVQSDVNGFRPTTEPREIIVGGEIANQGNITAIKGSVALIRSWSDVSDLKAKLDKDPEL